MDPTAQGFMSKVAGAIRGFVKGSGQVDPEMAAYAKAFGFGYADEAVAYVDKELLRRLEEHRPFHLDWRLNIGYLQGDQYLSIDGTGTDLVERRKEFWWQSRRVINQMAPINEVRTSKLTRGRVALKARPNSTEQKDIAAAKVSTKVLAANAQDQNWAMKHIELVAWMEPCGTAITKEIWNPKKGRLVGYQAQQVPGDAVPKDDAGSMDQTQPVTEQKAIREGDAETIVCNPFGILPDSPWHNTMEEIASILEARAYRIEDVYDIWGVVVQAEDVTQIGLQQNSALGMHGNGAGYRFGTSKLVGHAVVKELMERPTARYPEGRHIVVCNKKPLHIGPLPYRCGPDNTPDLPYTFWWSLRRPGCLWANSVHTRLRPLQDRYNEVRNLEFDYLRRVTIGQLVIEEDSVDMDDAEVNGGSHGYMWVVKKNTMRAPTPVQFPSLPSSVEIEKQTILQEFITLSGVSDISKTSAAPAGVKSGVALSIGLEQDDTRLSQTITNIGWASVEAGKRRLRLYRQFANEPRMSRIVGRDQDVDVLLWRGSDLTADDLFVEDLSALSESPAQRKQMVFDLLNAGFFKDPTGRITPEGERRLLDMLALGNWEDGTDTDQMQSAKQDRENRRLLNGQPVPVEDIDDDAIHLGRLVRFMLSPDYEEMLSGQNGQAIRAAFDQHRQLHMARLQAAAMQQAQAQLAMQQAQEAAKQSGAPIQ